MVSGRSVFLVVKDISAMYALTVQETVMYALTVQESL